MLYFVFTYLHVIGASVLLGTGAGIAFFMLMAHRSGDPRVVAGVARIVVIADFLFTATAVVLQPIYRRRADPVLWLRVRRALDRALNRSLSDHRRVLAGCRHACAISRRRRLPQASRIQSNTIRCSAGGSRSVSSAPWPSSRLMIARPPEILVGAGTPPGPVRWPER